MITAFMDVYLILSLLQVNKLATHSAISTANEMDEDDEYGADADFLAVLAASETAATKQQRVQQPTPQRIQQPTPQRLDRAPPTGSTGPKVVQPTPQAIASRSTGSSILVSPRQKGNPILSLLRQFGWEFSDIPADYVLGQTTCALFLSLKYHLLHPEYIYNRIKSLAGKYLLRILLVMVDIGTHEDSLKELSKTSLVNNVTIILCWSAAEAARYVELYKSYERADANAIKGVESKSYAEKMVDFVTVPRSINKTDAVSIVSAFGSIKAAVNARPEEVSVVSGWGEKKVRKWCGVVDEPFRARKAAKRTIARDNPELVGGGADRAIPLSRVPLRDMIPSTEKGGQQGEMRGTGQSSEATRQSSLWESDNDDEEALLAIAAEEERAAKGQGNAQASKGDELSGGIAAALAKLRETD
jgi:DNA excision repair protein ERCC-1